MPINVADIMTRQVIIARPDSTVAEVASLLTGHDISAVPVCADDGTLLGIISEGDLMRPFRQEHGLRRDWWIGILSSGEELARALADYIRQDHRGASDLMTQPVITASETASLVEIADLLLRHNIKRVPIVRDHQVVGIVSRVDLIRAMVLQRAVFHHRAWQPGKAGSDNPAPTNEPPVSGAKETV
jgi:CBS domain-containing protein